MSVFDELLKDVDDGIAGRNSGIPMGFTRLNSDVSIRKSTNYLLGGFTGSGKTSLLDDAFVLNPVDWYIKNYHKIDIRLHIIYFSMERKKKFKRMKWISRKIFLDTGKVISVSRLMGWCPKDQRLTKDEHDLFLLYRDYIEAISDIVDIRDGPENPTGIRNFMRDYHLSKGKLEDLDAYHKVYIPNDDHLIVMKIKDHVGLIPREAGLANKKEVIDKASEDDRRDRDLYGCACVNISQFNREISNPMRIKNGEVEPQMEDFKDSGSTQEDADVVLSLFDPTRYKVPDPSRYDLDKLRHNGSKKYRNLRILKNSYGREDVRIGLAFQPEIGLFKEMPKLEEASDDVYTSIRDNSYFLPEYKM